ncbi:hypothetical protein PCYB_126900 [Plasmodium cynomolgi strain B]|uniref:Uncharacterized protein n=1 Tax=Plasmodium cynomolgi (strain B) TaxID=1120755 RepID=K6UZL3_PLACD|nr:hypothetical protein PCYB_126900 [Plasmodium cynomolgi strain B]GAB68125.1 hypothetical protein PCYB_126900 [Plasmodium cynomolgi strain B]
MNHIDVCKKYRLRKTDLCGVYSRSPWRSDTNGEKNCTERRRMNHQGDGSKSGSASKQKEKGLDGQKKKNSFPPVGTFLNSSILDKGIETIWNSLKRDEDNSVDLFNVDVYSSLTERGKEKFQKVILPYLLHNAQKVDELKNILFEDEANPSGEFHFKNVCQVKRVANENDLCLLAKWEGGSRLQMKTPPPEMLIISRKAFFKIIQKECFVKDGPEHKNEVLLRTIQQMWKYKEVFFSNNEENALLRGDISERYFTLSDWKKWSEPSYKTGEPPLLGEDYHVMENENMLNDVIHESIMLMSKNSGLRRSTEEEDPKKGDLSKGTLKRRKFTQMGGSRREKKCVDPMGILKAFLKKDSIGVGHNDALRELRECTFQPNVRKFVEAEVGHVAREKVLQRGEKSEMHIKADMDANVDAKTEREDLFKQAGGHITSDVHKRLLEESSAQHANRGMEDERVAKYLQMCCLSYGVDMEKESKQSTYKRHDTTRQPTHRESRKIWRSRTPKVSSYTFEASMMGARKNANVRTPNGKNAWIDGLRGGYISNYFNFSVVDKNGALCGLGACKHDYSRDIRLHGRRLKTKVIPNVDLSNNMLRSPFSNANCLAEGVDTPGGSLIPSRNTWVDDGRNKIDGDRTIRRGEKKKSPSRASQPFLPLHNSQLTTAKWESQNVRAEGSNQLAGKITGGCSSFAPSDPPKVIAVKWEKSLDDMEKELLCLPQSVRFVQIC